MRFFVLVNASGLLLDFQYITSGDAPSGMIETDIPTYLELASGRFALIDGKLVPYTAPISAADIDRERDRRMYGGFLFNGVPFQTDATSISNILGSAQLAFMAIVGGAKPGDLSWTGSSQPFLYIAADNTKVQMDAQTVVAFAKAAAAFRSQIIYAGRVAKDALAAGKTVDVTADATWGMDSTSPTSTAKAA